MMCCVKENPSWLIKSMNCSRRNLSVPSVPSAVHTSSGWLCPAPACRAYHRYAFVSCNNCGYTEIYNLRTIEGKDNLGTFLEIPFSD
jgi:hypothetical protein